MRKNLTINTYGEFYEDGNWMITSDDLPGLILAGKDLHALLRDLPKVVKILLEKNYRLTEVKVDRADPPASLQRDSFRTIAPEGQWNATGEMVRA